MRTDPIRRSAPAELAAHGTAPIVASIDAAAQPGARVCGQLRRFLTEDANGRTREPTPLALGVPMPLAPIAVSLPRGAQATLPGSFWPELSVTQFQRPGRPVIGCWEITKEEAVRYLIEWRHKLHLNGEDYRRPYGSLYFLMEVRGRPAAVVVLASSCNTWVSKDLGLSRYDCVDLSRICRSPDHRDDYCLRAVLRLAREYLVPLWPERQPFWSTIEAVCANSMPGTSSARTDGKVSMYRFDGFELIRITKGKGGGGKRGRPSRAAEIEDGKRGLWVYIYMQITYTAGEAPLVIGRRPRSTPDEPWGLICDDGGTPRRFEDEAQARRYLARHATALEKTSCAFHLMPLSCAGAAAGT